MAVSHMENSGSHPPEVLVKNNPAVGDASTVKDLLAKGLYIFQVKELEACENKGETLTSTEWFVSVLNAIYTPVQLKEKIDKMLTMIPSTDPLRALIVKGLSRTEEGAKDAEAATQMYKEAVAAAEKARHAAREAYWVADDAVRHSKDALRQHVFHKQE